MHLDMAQSTQDLWACAVRGWVRSGQGQLCLQGLGTSLLILQDSPSRVLCPAGLPPWGGAVAYWARRGR